ncbi:MAG: AMP-binding protein [Rhodospirillaceae bacterium]|nr:AMP-binding protein [Rhodospirillaceae bacterium]MBT6829978.1 AMP-binding protein [Rhodospirillaceae bacterium]
MTDSKTLAELIARGEKDAPAIRAPERETMSFAGLQALCSETVGVLNGAGIGRGDRVAIVLPNSPEMATAFVSIAAGATAAPLNPAYQAKEFEFYLSDLAAKAVIVLAGGDSPVIEAAGKLNIPLIPLTPDTQGPAGAFTLSPPAGEATSAGGFAGADDIALILHTSGTTSRPKIVPLSHANIAASARNISAWLELKPEDSCLNVMPLFHIHGLIAAVLSSLYAGASVACAPGFNALRFFAWLDEIKPSWYTAVPTMHQAILARAGRNQEIVARNPLRLIRSSSSSLPAPVMTELEEVFSAPVIESYGMTEAAHQMASNPLPPRERRPGCVGIAAGPEVAIMDPAGELLATGATGEIVIRGDNVTAGYENNEKANAENFTNGWFRTGDQGVMDGKGYVTLTGRLKEIINRGGEKISPREVDDVLMTHPAVAQAVVFAMPHNKLGEDVAAAIVLREGKEASDNDIREFAAERLAAFKVPRKIVLLEEIPKGATGKLQRIGLAEKLGLVE